MQFDYIVSPAEWNSYFATEVPPMPEIALTMPSAGSAPFGIAPTGTPNAPMQTQQAAKVGIVTFADWLQNNYPKVYEGIMQTLPEAFIPEFALAGLKRKAFSMAGMSGDAAEATDESAAVTDWGTRLTELVNKLAPSLIQLKGQSDLIKLNIARAEKGLPPVSASDIAPQVNVGVSSDVAQMGKIAVYGLLGIGGLLVLSSFVKKGSR